MRVLKISIIIGNTPFHASSIFTVVAVRLFRSDFKTYTSLALEHTC